MVAVYPTRATPVTFAIVIPVPAGRIELWSYAPGRAAGANNLLWPEHHFNREVFFLGVVPAVRSHATLLSQFTNRRTDWFRLFASHHDLNFHASLTTSIPL